MPCFIYKTLYSCSLFTVSQNILQDTAMQRKALDLINQDSRLISPQRRKRALEEDSNDREDEGVDLNMPDSKTPKIQLTTMNKW